MPRVSIEQAHSLTAALREMGSPTDGDWSGLADGPLIVSDIVQRAVLEVDEDDAVVDRVIEIFSSESASGEGGLAVERVSAHQPLQERTTPMRRTLSVATVLALALATAACSSAGDETATAASSAMETMTDEAPTSDAATADGAMMDKDIVDTAVAAGDFTTLATALTAAGLVDTLKGEGPFTVFAPTDEAFAALPEGTLDTLLADPTGDLAAILKYHVVSGKVMAADVVTMDGQMVKTVNGAEFTVNVDGDAVTLTDAKGNTVNVTSTDIEASNGVIHVIDGVLLP